MAKVATVLIVLIVIWKLSSVEAQVFGLNFSAIVESLKVGGLALAVVQNQSYVETRGFGQQDLLGSRMTEDTGFFIGSLTKAFTATLAVALIKKHGRHLKDKVDLFYELNIGTPEQGDVNMIDLLAHRVGAGSYEFFWLTHGTEEGNDVLENPLTSKIEVVHQGFRSLFVYSSLMYWVAGESLEALVRNRSDAGETDDESGMSWCDLMTDLVLNELQLIETTCKWRDSGRDGIGGLMSAQLMWNGTHLVAIPPGIADQWQNVLAAAGMISSARDMVEWIRFNLKLKIPYEYGHYLNETVEDTHKMHMAIENHYGMKLSQFGISFHTYGYGLGWYIADYRGFRVLYHDGRLLGHQNLIWIIPEIEFGVYLAVTGGTNDTIQHLMLLAMYLTDEFSGNLTKPWLNEYTLVNWDTIYRQQLYYPPTQPHALEPLYTCNCVINTTEERVRYCEKEELYFKLSNATLEGNLQIKHNHYTNAVYGDMVIDYCIALNTDFVPSKPTTNFCIHINKFIAELQPTNLTNIYNLKTYGQFKYIKDTVFQRPLLVKISSQIVTSNLLEQEEITVCGLTLDPRVPPQFILKLNRNSQVVETLPIVFVILGIFIGGVILNSHKTIRKKINRHLLSKMPYKMTYKNGFKIKKREKISLLMQDYGNLTEHQKLVASICKQSPKLKVSVNKEDEEAIFKGLKSTDNPSIQDEGRSSLSAVVHTEDTTEMYS